MATEDNSCQTFTLFEFSDHPRIDNKRQFLFQIRNQTEFCIRIFSCNSSTNSIFNSFVPAWRSTWWSVLGNFTLWHFYAMNFSSSFCLIHGHVLSQMFFYVLFPPTTNILPSIWRLYNHSLWTSIWGFRMSRLAWN